ncbi:MAG: hypothetical protein ACI9MC_004209 [Kiritimatiellia bacterium]
MNGVKLKTDEQMAVVNVLALKDGTAILGGHGPGGLHFTHLDPSGHILHRHEVVLNVKPFQPLFLFERDGGVRAVTTAGNSAVAYVVDVVWGSPGEVQELPVRQGIWAAREDGTVVHIGSVVHEISPSGEVETYPLSATRAVYTDSEELLLGFDNISLFIGAHDGATWSVDAPGRNWGLFGVGDGWVSRVLQEPGRVPLSYSTRMIDVRELHADGSVTDMVVDGIPGGPSIEPPR